tara:strand:- start:1269 stop:1832 length:564 start_codon:yes stop_codon:yes gene_type:complete
MGRRRKLRPEEEALWNAVARTAKPMHSTVLKRKSDDTPTVPVVLPPAPMRLHPFRIGEKPKPPAPVKPPSTALSMDARAFGKMTKGKLSPEARIDLHGMTLAEAHPDLIHFVLSAHAGGLRLVLVITGKGKPGEDHGPIPQRAGVLRHQVPHWLRQVPLAPVILQVNEAHQRHGGSGAYYVYLRRQR